MTWIADGMRSWIAQLCLLAPAIAQVDEFDRTSTRGTDSVAEARASVQAFLRIEHGTAREDRLSVAARCAFVASELELCLAWCDEAEQRAPLADQVQCLRLRSLLVLRRDRDFLGIARIAFDRSPSALQGALLADEGLGLNVADARMRDGDLSGGLWIFERIAELPPSSAARLCNFALALRHAGELDRSRKLYEEALALAPNDAWTWNDYGLLLRASGDAAAAKAAFLRSMECDAQAGQGPGITNVVLEAALGKSSAEDRAGVLESASRALAVRPDAALLRRAALDLALGPKRPDSSQLETDTAAGRR